LCTAYRNTKVFFIHHNFLLGSMSVTDSTCSTLDNWKTLSLAFWYTCNCWILACKPYLITVICVKG
jgi:hypothetical protein